MSFYCPTVGQWKGGGSSSVETFMCPQAFAERSLIGQFDFVTLTDWTYFNFSWAFMKFRIDFLLDPSFVSWSYYCQVFEFLGIINDINDLDWLTQSNEGVWISGKLFPLFFIWSEFSLSSRCSSSSRCSIDVSFWRWCTGVWSDFDFGMVICFFISQEIVSSNGPNDYLAFHVWLRSAWIKRDMVA